LILYAAIAPPPPLLPPEANKYLPAGSMVIAPVLLGPKEKGLPGTGFKEPLLCTENALISVLELEAELVA
jgi:hypothetical protein